MHMLRHSLTRFVEPLSDHYPQNCMDLWSVNAFEAHRTINSVTGLLFIGDVASVDEGSLSKLHSPVLTQLDSELSGDIVSDYDGGGFP